MRNKVSDKTHNGTCNRMSNLLNNEISNRMSNLTNNETNNEMKNEKSMMMGKRVISYKRILEFAGYLDKEEKSDNIIEKYIRDVRAFVLYVKNMQMKNNEHIKNMKNNEYINDMKNNEHMKDKNREQNEDDSIMHIEQQEIMVTKEIVISYKNKLLTDNYAVRSINSMLASLNSFFSFCGWNELKVKSIKFQRPVYCSEDKELTKDEYRRLIYTARNEDNERLNLIIQTICGTGIRVSELQYITVESVKRGEAIVSLKGKTRSVFIVSELQKKLLRYISNKKILSGAVFVTRNGKPMCRTNIWREMKKLCQKAGVNPQKVFPHNLRHLFARTFYSVEKDIAKLADILGHSSINITRIYIMTTGTEHRRRMENLRLII